MWIGWECEGSLLNVGKEIFGERLTCNYSSMMNLRKWIVTLRFGYNWFRFGSSGLFCYFCY
jgi:hypothetical protein